MVPRLLTLARSTLALALVAAAPAAAQYTAPGPSEGLLQSRETQLRAAMEEARWHWGPFRVQPWIGLRDVSYRDNVATADGEETSDVSATAGAGLRLYTNLGRDVIFAAHALPEYVYWFDLDDRNEVTGRYGVGIFAFLNRLALEVSGQSDADVDFASSEVLEEVPQTRTEYTTNAQLRLGGAVAVFAGATLIDLEYDEIPGLPGDLDLLEREERRYRAGLRYLLRGERGHVGVGAEREETRFELAPRRDTEGTAPYVEVLLRGNKIDVGLDYVQRDTEPSADGSFPGYDESSGSALVVLRPGGRFSFQLYGRRDLRYSALVEDAFYRDDRFGAGVDSSLGHRISWRAFYEVGEASYFGVSAGRVDDVDAYGISLALELWRQLRLQLGFQRSEYTSNVAGFDRELDQILASLTFGSGGRAGAW